MIRRLSLLLLTGCMANNGLGSYAESQNNIWGLSRLCVGMNESQVLQIMRYPYSKKTLKCEGATYEFWYYVTRQAGLDQSRLVRQNLTPLTFENGMLLGWGHDFQRYILSQLEEPAKTREENLKHPKDSLQKAIEGMEETRTPVETSQNQKVNKQPSKQSPPQKKDKKKSQKSQSSKEGDKDSELDDKSREMIQEENDQNFNFW